MNPVRGRPAKGTATTALGRPASNGMKIVLSGGGTGGHITPLLAVAHELKDHELHYIGEGSVQEKRLLATESLMTHTILAGKFRRYHGANILSQLTDVKTFILNIRDGFKFIIGIIQSLYLLIRIKPEVFFSKGGYVALPVGLAAVVLRIPIITHDSDVVPGLSNRILNKFSAARACGFPRAGSVFTGTPVREAIIQAKPLKIATHKPVLLVMGGSLGAQALNSLVAAALDDLLSQFYVIHLTGEKHLHAAHQNRVGYEAHAFMGEEIGGVIKAADVVLSRAGATAISELAALKKACLLVPASQLTGGHQTKNGQVLESQKAALIIKEADLTPKTLMTSINEVLRNKKNYQNAISKFYQPDAAAKLANLIVQKGSGGE